MIGFILLLVICLLFSAGSLKSIESDNASIVTTIVMVIITVSLYVLLIRMALALWA